MDIIPCLHRKDRGDSLINASDRVTSAIVKGLPQSRKGGIDGETYQDNADRTQTGVPGEGIDKETSQRPSEKANIGSQ